ncbi:MAG: hypothetical protein RLZZ273_1270 [Bacteroidota bacterium]
MIRHHITLQHLAGELSELLEGSVLACAWTQAKDTAMLMFAHQESEILLECDLSPEAGTIFHRDTVRRARRNTLDIFEAAYGQPVSCVTKHSGDRIICIWLHSVQIHAELFSGGSGNLLLVRDNLVIDALHDGRNRIGREYRDRITEQRSLRYDRPCFRVLGDRNSLLGKWFAIEACIRAGVDASIPYQILTHDQRIRLDDSGSEVLREASESKCWLVLSIDNEIVLSPIKLANSTIIESHQHVLTAIGRTLALRNKRASFDEQKRIIERTLSKRIERIESTLRNLGLDQARDNRAADYKRFGDLLMSQSNVQISGLTSIEVHDYVADASVSIALQPKSSLLENAQRYYEKSRSALRASQERQRRMPALERERDRLRQLLQRASTAVSITELPELPSQLKPMDAKNPTKPPEEQFRTFVIDDQHTLYVGKSAANNDQLTMKFARQQDWWLHVRGASGSHAVLRGVLGPKVPKQVLETAAAITAYYSQARNASYVPVVYTQRKHVRKPKGANVGAVVIDREQTVMVKPGLPIGTQDED